MADEVFMLRGPGGEEDAVVCVQEEPSLPDLGFVGDACLHGGAEQRCTGLGSVCE
jgi:hypothetical protein